MRVKILVILAFLLFSLARFCGAFDSKKPFDISADILEYDEVNQEMTAEGHVVVTQEDSSIAADYLRYDRAQSRLFARGNVVVNQQSGMFFGDQFDYDMKTERGSMVGGKGLQSPWKFQSARWEKMQDYYLGRQASFTSCDLHDPHYHIRSSRVHLVPDRYFWAWSNMAYADTLPVFYSPFMYKSLEQRWVVLQVQPGHDEVNGNFVKTVTTLRYTDKVYEKLYLDHYAIQGTGFGSELNYEPSSEMKGSLFGYYIDPKGNPELAGAPSLPQYNLRSYHWQRLSPTLTLQANANLRKNVSFNNQYFPQDTNQSVTDVTSSLALTHQNRRVNQHLVVERMDSPDSGDNALFGETHMQSASSPRYDYTVFQISLWQPKNRSSLLVSSNTLRGATTTYAGMSPLSPPVYSTGSLLGLSTSYVRYSPPPLEHVGPLQLSLSGNAGNFYTRVDDRIHTKSSHQASLSQSYNLSRSVSFTPSVSPQLSWQEKVDAGSSGQERGFQGRLNTSDVLRWKATRAVTLDQTYSMTGRLSPNDLTLDRGLSDGGIETHHVSWFLYARPNQTVQLRSSSGYDLRRLSDEDPQAYLQRKWDPWINELTLDPSRHTQYFMRYQLGYYPTRVTSWEASVRHGGRYGTVVETGLLYNRGIEGLLTWNNRIGIFLSPGWRVDATVHTYVRAPNSTTSNVASLIDTEFIVTRDLHCWNTQFIYRNRPPFSREYSILFNLKFNTEAQKKIRNEDLESQFYPWRAYNYAQ